MNTMEYWEPKFDQIFQFIWELHKRHPQPTNGSLLKDFVREIEKKAYQEGYDSYVRQFRKSSQ